MGRMKSKDNRSLNLIIAALSEAPDGLWIMEISRRTKLNPNTVAYHVRQHPELFDEQSVEGPRKAFFRAPCRITPSRPVLRAKSWS